MTTRDDRISEEALALWREMFGDAPPAADGPALLEIIASALPEVGYDRISSPHLRPSLISRPRRQSTMGRGETA
jgi:hypothetical protein